MASFDAILQPPARLFYDEIAIPSERAEIDRIIEAICADPYIDEAIKFPFPYEPAVAVLYSDGWFWLIYHTINNWTISILNIGFEEEIPKPERT